MSRFEGSDNRQWQQRQKMVFVNSQIKAPTITIIDETGAVLWTFPRNRAFDMASEQEKDLVQMTYDPEKMISTAKLIDYGKYMYDKGKREKEKKKSQKGMTTKELKIKYAIGDNDLRMKMDKAKEMLAEWYSVKVVIRLKGREKIYSEKAKERLVQLLQELSTSGRPQSTIPKEEWQWYSILLFPKSG